MPDFRRRSSSSSSSGSGQDLSSDQVEKLVQLGDLTGIDDLEVCRAILESKNWDLESAAREHFDPNPPGPSAEPSAGTPPAQPHRESPEIRHRLFDEIHDPPPPPPVPPSNINGSPGILNTIMYYVTFPVFWPLKFAFQTFTGIFSYLLGFNLFGGRPLPPVNPAQEVNAFRRSFDDEYPGHGLEFFSGTYSQCLEVGKRELRFIVVYLHCPSHQDTPTFVTNVLLSGEFKDFLSEQNVLLFGCSVESREGHRVSQAVRVNAYPTLAVIVLRQNRMMIVGRQEGYADAQRVVRNLTAVVSDNEAFIVAARADRAERETNESIRREQDLAFQETLRRDQEKERLRKEKEEEEKRERERREALEKREEDRKLKIARAKAECAAKVPREPEDSKEAVRILIKLPEGQRLERKFLKTESLKYLFYYVFSHPDSPSDFDITTNFPRKVLPCRPANFFLDLGIDVGGASGADEEPPTFEEAGIKGSTVLFVNDLEA